MSHCSLRHRLGLVHPALTDGALRDGVGCLGSERCCGFSSQNGSIGAAGGHRAPQVTFSTAEKTQPASSRGPVPSLPLPSHPITASAAQPARAQVSLVFQHFEENIKHDTIFSFHLLLWWLLGVWESRWRGFQFNKVTAEGLFLSADAF